MNICFVVPEFTTEKEAGGLASYYDNISRLLADNGHFVVIFVVSDVNEDVDYYKNILVKRIAIDIGKVNPAIPGSFMRLWSYEINNAVREYINEGNKVDIVQYPNFMGLGFDRLDDIPTVVRVSSFRPHLRVADQEFFNPNQEFKSIKVPDFLEELSVIKADSVYGPSAATNSIISKETKKEIVLIESPFYPNNLPGNMANFDCLDGKKYILTFGSLKALKGAKVVGDCIYSVLDKYKDICWVFAGNEMPWIDENGNRVFPTAYIMEKAREYSDRVFFLSKVAHDRLWSVIKDAECCVMPSRVDNLPNTCIEAMALGKIVIGTRGASFEQLIDDSVSGFLIDREKPEQLCEALDKFFALGEKRANIEASAKERIKKMEPMAVYDMLMKLYSKTIFDYKNSDFENNSSYSQMKEEYNNIIRECDIDEIYQYLL